MTLLGGEEALGVEPAGQGLVAVLELRAQEVGFLRSRDESCQAGCGTVCWVLCATLHPCPLDPHKDAVRQMSSALCHTRAGGSAKG